MKTDTTSENISIVRLYSLVLSLKDEIKQLHGEIRTLGTQMKGVKEIVGKNK